jgi:ABC-2 type transport system ATP-binding protein
MAIAPPPTSRSSSPPRLETPAEPAVGPPAPQPAVISAPVLACSGLRKLFGERRAVDGVGFSIGPGETYGLLGPNGAGKTTTISMICGIMRRDEGEVRIAGRAMDPDATSLKAEIGYVPQDLAIYPDLSARENLDFFGRLYGLKGPRRKARIDEVLEVVDLTDRAADRTATYSGGMKRRLNIAIGLLHRPSLLVLDEPTVGVDPQSRNAILTSVEALSAAGMGILYTTHYMEEAARLCDRVGIMDDGRIIAEGTRRQLVAMVGELDRVSLVATGDLAVAAQALRAIPGVRKVTTAEGRIDVLVAEARRLLPRLLEAVSNDGVTVRSVEVIEPDLESVFLHLTGKALRD